MPRPGLGPAVLSLGRTAVQVLGTRAQLLGIELLQEREHAVRVAIHTGLALVAGFLLLQLLALLCVAWFWDTPFRLVSIACLTAVVGAVAAASLLALAGTLRAKQPAFEGSLRMLADDAEFFR